MLRPGAGIATRRIAPDPRFPVARVDPFHHLLSGPRPGRHRLRQHPDVRPLPGNDQEGNHRKAAGDRRVQRTRRPPLLCRSAPIRTGMLTRLGFAVATATDPDILLLTRAFRQATHALRNGRRNASKAYQADQHPRFCFALRNHDHRCAIAQLAQSRRTSSPTATPVLSSPSITSGRSSRQPAISPWQTPPALR